MEIILSDIKHTTELANDLSIDDVTKLILYMKIPAALCKTKCNVESFLLSVRNWEEFNPESLQEALSNLRRPELLKIASKITWLNKEPEFEYFNEELSFRSFVTLLRSEITKKELKILAINLFNQLKGKTDFESIITVCLETGLISKNIKVLEDFLKVINRLDLITKANEYESLFAGMTNDEFIQKMKDALAHQTKEKLKWDELLKIFLCIKYKKVAQMLGDEESIDFESVYVELTILNQRPPPVNLEDETTYNEIAHLMKIANKEIEITPVDLRAELQSYKVSSPEIWCLIGNPGCGKTFLSRWIALKFSKNEFKNLSFSISIPCRTPEWHSLESTRIEEDKEVTTESVQEWLCLGLPSVRKWSKDLANYLSKSDGEGLLLIIDGLDEFSKNVQFEKTLLYLLLTRKTLSKSTIILTTRPGAWTDTSSKHILKIDRFYQILGFSPKNRDVYFEKQLANEDKIKKCKSLLQKYDEMNQLSLIPVNASLFAALLKDESVTINTLTQLYNELTCYLIKRQLIRMGLKQLAEVTKLEMFHSCVLDCLHAIGLIALQGVGRRELTSTEKVSLTIEEVEKESHCLGLVHEYHMNEGVGKLKKVWAFPHLTMQEFASAIWLNSTPWTNQCLSVRYIADSDESFSLFRMVVRFLCGLLCEKSAAVLTILYKLLTRQTIENIPMYYQLRFDGSIFDIGNGLIVYTGWIEFTAKYFLLNPILFESNSKSIRIAFKQFLPNSISIYLNNKVLPVPPNEWTCFLQSLQLVNQIQLIHIDADVVDLTQFESLLKEMRNYSLSYFALKFEKNYFSTKSSISAKVLAYTHLIANTELGSITKISIDLYRCQLTVQTAVNLFSLPATKNVTFMRLTRDTYSDQMLRIIASFTLSCVQYLWFEESETKYDLLLPSLSQATQLRGLYVPNLPNGFGEKFLRSLPPFSALEEISYPHYSLIPQIIHLSRIKHLELRGVEIEDKTLSNSLLQMLNMNKESLRVLNLWNLNRLGFNSWKGFLNALQLCVNLTKIQLSFIYIPPYDVTEWRTTVSKLQSLIQLEFFNVTLYNTGFLSVCQGLVYHPTIKYIHVSDCGQNFNSCEPLSNLIPTVPHLEKLTVNNLSEQQSEPIKILKKLSEGYSIKTSFP